MSFAERLTERVKVPNLSKSLGKQRGRMPQLTKFDDFKADLAKHGHKMTSETTDPDLLTPTQGNFNQEKVDNLKKKGWDAKPIITTKDGYIVDGHHRWLAAHQLGKQIDTKVVDMDIDDMLDFCKDKSYVETKRIDEMAARYDSHVGWTGGSSDEFDISPHTGKPVYHYRYDPKTGRNEINHNYEHEYAGGKKFHHVVAFKDKEAAKAEGMRWDGAAKKWYHTSADKSARSKFPVSK